MKLIHGSLGNSTIFARPQLWVAINGPHGIPRKIQSISSTKRTTSSPFTTLVPVDSITLRVSTPFSKGRSWVIRQSTLPPKSGSSSNFDAASSLVFETPRFPVTTIDRSESLKVTRHGGHKPPVFATRTPYRSTPGGLFTDGVSPSKAPSQGALEEGCE